MTNLNFHQPLLQSLKYVFTLTFDQFNAFLLKKK